MTDTPKNGMMKESGTDDEEIRRVVGLERAFGRNKT